MFDLIKSFDTQFILWVQDFIRSPFLSSVFVPLTSLGNNGMIFIAAGLILAIFKKTRKIGLLLLASITLTYIVNDLIIKNIIKRARPFSVIEGLSTLVHPPRSYSFPSGHTASAFSAMTSLFFTKRKYLPFGLIFAFLMGLSRIYVGVHYLTDVICGAFVGVICAFITGYIFKNKIKVYDYEKE